ncbi:MAG TPA: RES family NAD+ phosphorylase [Terriglobales bacterium]|nr:RES family NAD+ phosphorylase [Terriglobales bacterium]
MYRVLRKPYARTPFDGEGSYQYGGRWSSPGTRLSYASEHQSLAMLEYFVHLEASDAPPDLVLASADIPDDLSRQQIEVGTLPANWRETPAPAELARLGDEFVLTGKDCILIVPSALVPNENNWLVNPLHEEFQKIKIRETEPLTYDSRLSARGRSSRHKHK